MKQYSFLALLASEENPMKRCCLSKLLGRWVSQTTLSHLITPLYKSGIKTKVENYCPISNLASLSKVFEKMVLARINQLHPNHEGQGQHGFRQNRSTFTALLEIQHEVMTSLDNNLHVSTYSLDM